jgi:hypothetical protein
VVAGGDHLELCAIELAGGIERYRIQEDDLFRRFVADA